MPADRVLQTLSYTFDASLFQFFHTWGSGAALVFLTSQERRDPNRIVEKVRAFRISVLGVPPSLWKLLLDHPDIGKCPSLRMGFCGGEPLSEEIRRRYLNRIGIPLHNVYGPTEASMEATFWTAGFANREEPVSIGRAIDGARTYVLNEALEETPEGFEGELFIAGVGVTRGYLGDPAKTAAAFLPDPFGEVGSRMYRTGDRVRKLSGGCLDFCGRKDDQVKLHGQRIELGEISAALDALPVVRESAVFLLKEYLVAYVALRDHREDAATEVRAQLRERIPAYMVPASSSSIRCRGMSTARSTATRSRRHLARLSAEQTLLAKAGLSNNFSDNSGVRRLARRSSPTKIISSTWAETPFRSPS